MRSETKRRRGENDSCDHKRASVEQISFFLVLLHASLLSLRQQIAKPESVTQYFLAGGETNRRLKDGTVENERMEFAVLAARIDAGRQIGEERFVEDATREGRIEDTRIYTNHNCLKTQAQKIAREFARITLPDGEQRFHPDLREIPLSINAQVFEENIAEGHSLDTAREMLVQSFFHSRFVRGVDALWRDQDRVERQADGRGLPLEQHAAHAVHADAVVLFCDGGEQRGDARSVRRLERMKRHRAVSTSAPAK